MTRDRQGGYTNGSLVSSCTDTKHRRAPAPHRARLLVPGRKRSPYSSPGWSGRPHPRPPRVQTAMASWGWLVSLRLIMLMGFHGGMVRRRPVSQSSRNIPFQMLHKCQLWTGNPPGQQAGP